MYLERHGPCDTPVAVFALKAVLFSQPTRWWMHTTSRATGLGHKHTKGEHCREQEWMQTT